MVKDLKVNKKEFTKDESILVNVEIENVSDIDGCEIVQLYINDKFAEVARPNKELKDFKRVFLKAREKKKVEFEISTDKLSYYHFDGTYYADNGEFDIYIGGSSEVENYITIKLI